MSDFTGFPMTLTYKINTEISQTLIEQINGYTKRWQKGHLVETW